MILKSLFFLSGIFLISKAYSQSTPEIWRNILKENSECVTWVSASVRIEISSNGRSYPPSERNIEALGTVLDASGMTVLSLNQLDPTDSIHSKIRNHQADIKVNYIQRLINEAEQGSVESLNEFWKIPETEYADVMGLDPQSRSDFIVNRRTFLSTIGRAHV
mgnify:CR=1 FL=1